MRLTIWKMMLAVAVFTIALYVGLSYRRSGDYRRQAQFYAHVGERAFSGLATSSRAGLPGTGIRPNKSKRR